MRLNTCVLCSLSRPGQDWVLAESWEPGDLPEGLWLDRALLWRGGGGREPRTAGGSEPGPVHLPTAGGTHGRLPALTWPTRTQCATFYFPSTTFPPGLGVKAARVRERGSQCPLQGPTGTAVRHSVLISPPLLLHIFLQLTLATKEAGETEVYFSVFVFFLWGEACIVFCIVLRTLI